MTEKKQPLRMCVICRKMLPKAELIRIVKTEDGYRTGDGRTPGRGAYICKSPACVAKCCAKRPLNKILKTEVSEEIYAALREESTKD